MQIYGEAHMGAGLPQPPCGYTGLEIHNCMGIYGEVARMVVGPPQLRGARHGIILSMYTGKLPVWWLAHPGRHVDIRDRNAQLQYEIRGSSYGGWATPAAMCIYGA